MTVGSRVAAIRTIPLAGKLFHSKLRCAVTATNLLEMCEHRMELVVKVERMRRAVLVSAAWLSTNAVQEGLLPEFSSYNSPPATVGSPMAWGHHPRPFGGPRGQMGGPWGQFGGPGGRFGGPGGYFGGPNNMVARGGQLVVAGSVVGQWGANWGPGGARLGGQVGPRLRGNRGGRKVREKKEEENKEREEKIKILTKVKSEKEEDVVVEG